MSELNAAGYSGAPFVSVASGFIASLPSVPRDGTVLHAPETGALAVMLGAARVDFLTWSEYVAAGYEHARAVRVPMRSILSFGTTPRDGTVLYAPETGALAVMAGGARIDFWTCEEYVAAGYQHANTTRVPVRAIQGFGMNPGDGTRSRDPATGAIAHILEGTKYTFKTWQEYVDAGYDTPSSRTSRAVSCSRFQSDRVSDVGDARSFFFGEKEPHEDLSTCACCAVPARPWAPSFTGSGDPSNSASARTGFPASPAPEYPLVRSRRCRREATESHGSCGIFGSACTRRLTSSSCACQS